MDHRLFTCKNSSPFQLLLIPPTGTRDFVSRDNAPPVLPIFSSGQRISKNKIDRLLKPEACCFSCTGHYMQGLCSTVRALSTKGFMGPFSVGLYICPVGVIVSILEPSGSLMVTPLQATNTVIAQYLMPDSVPHKFSR